MEKREKVIVVLVVIAMIYGAIDYTVTSNKKKAARSQAQTANQAAGEITNQLQAVSAPEERKVDSLATSITEPWPGHIFVTGAINFDTDKKSEEKKDENSAAQDLRALAEQLVYSGFLSTDSDQIAIINGMDYRVGEEVDGFTITAISKESIKVSQDEAVFDIPARIEMAKDLPAAGDVTPPQNNN